MIIQIYYWYPITKIEVGLFNLWNSACYGMMITVYFSYQMIIVFSSLPDHIKRAFTIEYASSVSTHCLWSDLNWKHKVTELFYPASLLNVGGSTLPEMNQGAPNVLLYQWTLESCNLALAVFACLKVALCAIFITKFGLYLLYISKDCQK